MPYLVAVLLACTLIALSPCSCGAASPPRGRVAVLSDSFPVRPGNADPAYLKSRLEENNYQVTVLSSEEVADPNVLTPLNFDCLVLPYGPSYPYAAHASIKAYLKAGGSFLSMGGYAFDEPCERASDGRMVPMKRLGEGATAPACLNTRFGRPADTMGLEADQIGVFDPSYHLRYGVGFRSAPMQSVIPSSVAGKMPLEGYSACSMLGSNSPVFPEKWGRHVPLVDVVDAYGRLRGSAGSMALNYAGPYAGSSWAFFGVTNTDLFGRNGPLAGSLGTILDALLRKTFMHSLSTDLASYRLGEPVSITCMVTNLGRSDQQVEIRFRVHDRADKRVFESQPRRVGLAPGQTEVLTIEYSPKSFSSDLYRVVAEMRLDGRLIDTIETGFVAHSQEVMASGLKINYKDNYFRIGDTPVLLSGTNATGAVFYSRNENPLVWDRDLARMNETGLNILRVLHFSPFMSDRPSPGAVTPSGLALDRMPIKIERQLDALVQLCQRHGIALFLSIHDWMPVELTDTELAAQRKFAKLIAERYRDVPGFMIDIQNEPYIEPRKQARSNENQDVLRAWNDYLRQKYGSDGELKSAWKLSPPEAPLGSVPYSAGSDAWEDMRTFDADYFRNVLLTRWADANYAGAKEGDPNVPVTVGFLQEYFAVNKLLCVEGLDFANMHSYNSVDVLRGDLKLFDRRFEGKSISLGEFGALPDHEKRVHGQDNPGQDISRYLLTGHYLFGLGGSFIASWCWKDMDDVVFPWGMNYTCDGPRKDLLKAYRNQSLLLRPIRPVYKPPSVFLVVPVTAMLGGQAGWTTRILYRHVDALLASGVEFGTIDDKHIDMLPASAKVLVYPTPMSVPDDAYTKLRTFVESGGQLLITGDISYDDFRRRGRAERLEELCGVRLASEEDHASDWGDGDRAIIDVGARSATTDGQTFVHRVGKGQVRYTPVPSAMVGEPRRYAFEDTLRERGKVLGDASTDVHLMRLQEPDGECIFAANTGKESKTVRIGGPKQAPVEIILAPGGTGLVRYRNGKPCAVESSGTVRIGSGRDSLIIPSTSHFALVALDSADLASSREVMVIPFGEGRIDLSSLPGLANVAAQAGDVIDGRWVALSQLSGSEINITAETAFDIRVIAPKSRLAELGKRITDELMLR